MNLPFGIGQLIAELQNLQSSPWYQTATKAKNEQHAVINVVQNLIDAAQLHTLAGKQHYEPPFVSLFGTVALAEQILDARVEFFNDMKLPAKAKFNGKERDIVFFCPHCQKSDCPNADIGVLIEIVDPPKENFK